MRHRNYRSSPSATSPPGVAAERAQPAAGRGDPGRRPCLPRVGADRRRGLAAAVLRELPHDGRRCPCVDGGRPRSRDTTREGAHRERRAASGGTQGARGARRSTVRLPRDVGGLEPVPVRDGGASAHGGNGARARSGLVDVVRRPVGAVGLGGAGRERVRRAGGDQQAHRDRGAEDPGGARMGGRRKDPADGRSVLVSLTAPGRAEIEHLFPRFNDEEAKLVATLTDEEQEELAARLRVSPARSTGVQAVGDVGCGSAPQPLYRVVSRTGIRLIPFTKFERIRSTWPASSIDRVAAATPGTGSSSRAARGAPPDRSAARPVRTSRARSASVSHRRRRVPRTCPDLGSR